MSFPLSFEFLENFLLFQFHRLEREFPDEANNSLKGRSTVENSRWRIFETLQYWKKCHFWTRLHFFFSFHVFKGENDWQEEVSCRQVGPSLSVLNFKSFVCIESNINSSNITLRSYTLPNMADSTKWNWKRFSFWLSLTQRTETLPT